MDRTFLIYDHSVRNVLPVREGPAMRRNPRAGVAGDGSVCGAAAKMALRTADAAPDPACGGFRVVQPWRTLLSPAGQRLVKEYTWSTGRTLVRSAPRTVCACLGFALASVSIGFSGRTCKSLKRPQ